jgi:gamma-glutamyltranspeptidase
LTRRTADNYPEAGKRPLSSTAPTIVEHADGSFAAALGGSGGSRIFGAVFQVLLNLDWGLDASAAVEFWRVHTQLVPEEVDADEGFPAHVLAGLEERGHKLTGARTFGLKCLRSHRFPSNWTRRGRRAAHRATTGRADIWCAF